MKEYRVGSDLEFISQQVDHMQRGDIHLVNNCCMDFPTMRMALCKIAKDNHMKFKTRRINKCEMTIERII